MRRSVALLALGLALSGCFGRSDPKADYIERTDEACRAYAKREAKLRAEIRRARVERDTDRALESARGLSRLGNQEVAAIRKIEPPAEDKATIDRLLATAKQATAATNDAIEATEQGDRKRQFVAIGTTRKRALKAARQARDYGFDVCLTGRR